MDGGFYYVDKTMLIYDLLHNGGQNNLITRPRRFGKSEVYNPWSVLNQAKTWARDIDAFAVPWWINTSSNNIIKTLVG